MKSCFGCPLFLVVLLVEQENLSIDVSKIGFLFSFPATARSLSLSLSPHRIGNDCGSSCPCQLQCFHTPRQCDACFGCQFFHMFHMLKHAHDHTSIPHSRLPHGLPLTALAQLAAARRVKTSGRSTNACPAIWSARALLADATKRSDATSNQCLTSSNKVRY